MSSSIELLYENTFNKVDLEKVSIERSAHHIFTCGGVVDVKSPTFKSFRHQFIDYTANKKPNIHDSIVLAEDFKDYLHQNIYTDLLVFEDEIAQISTLVVIFLESAGSLVELGMFCSKPEVFKKLLIIAPSEKTEDADSFIYLGPLQFIKSKNEKSVLIYPWPKLNLDTYDNETLFDLCDVVESKLNNQRQTKRFSQESTGDVALLVYEIIRMSYPLLSVDIEHIFYFGLELDITDTSLTRHLYLLQKLRLIDKYEYSDNDYFYPISPDLQMVKFGYKRGSQRIDLSSLRLAILEVFREDESSRIRKRQAAMTLIFKRLKSNGK